MTGDQVVAGMKKLQEGMAMLSGGPFSYTMDCLMRAQELLLTKYAPFKVGDRVELARTPEISDKIRWGWRGSRHFLIEGAKATVVETYIDREDIRVAVHFEDESWIDPFSKVKRPIAEKHQYVFRCEDLRPAGAEVECIADAIGGAG